MWDAPVETAQSTVPREMSCPQCGHGLHVHVACGDGCDCDPQDMPGTAT